MEQSSILWEGTEKPSGKNHLMCYDALGDFFRMGIRKWRWSMGKHVAGGGRRVAIAKPTITLLRIIHQNFGMLTKYKNKIDT